MVEGRDPILESELDNPTLRFCDNSIGFPNASTAWTITFDVENLFGGIWYGLK
jgi:hypothetical protein